MPSARRILTGGVLVTAALGITVAGVLAYQTANGSTALSDRYRLVTAGPGTVTTSLSLSGTVHHVDQVSVSFPTMGTVTQVHVKAGDRVAAGAPLATIDSTPLQDEVLAAEAAYQQARLKLEIDQKIYDAKPSAASAPVGAGRANPAAGAAAGGAGGGGPAVAAGGSHGGAPAGAPGPAAGPGGATLPGAAPDPQAAARAAAALAALQQSVAAVQAEVPVFAQACLAPLQSQTPFGPAPTVTVTQTVTATQTVTTTATPSASATPSGSVSATPSRTASTAAGSRTATPIRDLPAATVSAPTPSATASPSAPRSLDPACQASAERLSRLAVMLPQQMTTAQQALVAAQQSLTAQAALLQAQAAQVQQQGRAVQQQAAVLRQQAVALQQQAALLRQQAAALQGQAAAAAQAAARGGSGTVTEAGLISDRAAVDQAALALRQARDHLAGATITAPVAGVVASIPFTVGQPASIASSAVIIGPGAVEITAPVSLAQRPQVAPGQKVTVSSVIGASDLSGTTTRIGLLPMVGALPANQMAAAAASAAASASAAAGSAPAAGATNSSVSYPVVITVGAGGADLPEGSRVQVSITTLTTQAAVMVPASAITPQSTTTGTVSVVVAGKVETRTVTLGARSGADVEVLSGIAAGEQVVIADRLKPLPEIDLNRDRSPEPNTPSSSAQPGAAGTQSPQPGQPATTR